MHTNRLILAITLIVAVSAYLYGLDSIHIPNVGDEWPYLQITRVTAQSGHLLPLVWENGITDTKPPMLFWQGILSTMWGAHWGLWNLRLPIVLYSFLVALTVGVLARKISGRKTTGLIAGCVYLGFMSTIQQGRPFLVNAPETLFLFLPFGMVFFANRFTWWQFVACGVSLGMAALYKSFFLVVVGCFALSLVFFYRSHYGVIHFIKRYSLFVIVVFVVGMGMFSVWILVDPNPGLVFSQFFVKENAGKFNAHQFWTGLFFGRYTLWRIWLGGFVNAGLYAVLLIGLVVDLIKRHKTLGHEEKQLWFYILAFFIIYSFPTQRQENYILPTSAALSVLVALRWDSLASYWFRISLGIIALLFIGSLWVQHEFNRTVGENLFSIDTFLAVMVFGLMSIIGLFNIGLGRMMFPMIVLSTLLTGSLFLVPFSKHFKPETCRKLQNMEIPFPSNFVASQEAYRFIIPGIHVKGYPSGAASPVGTEPYVAMKVDCDKQIPQGYKIVDWVYDLKTRHSPQQIKAILFHRRCDLLVDRLAILERTAGASLW